MAKKNTVAVVSTKHTSKKSAKSVPVASSPVIGTTLDAIVKIARTVNPGNILDVVTRHNRNHGIVTRNVGRYTGMRVMAFQNASFIANEKWQLDDCQLLAVWVMEFPATVGRVFAINGTLGTPDAAGVRDGIAIIRGVRSDYNRTGHGMTPERKPAAIQSSSFGSKRFDIAVPTVDAKPAAATSTKKSGGKKSAAA